MFELRAGRAADVDAMYRLDLLCFAPPFCFSLRAMRAFASQPNAFTIVAEHEGELIGFVLVELDDATASAYVDTLDVHPAHRRHGIAAALMMQAERQVAEAGARQIGLHVHTKNEQALKLYERAGYAMHSRVKRFYGSSLDAWIYVKTISAQAAGRPK